MSSDFPDQEFSEKQDSRDFTQRAKGYEPGTRVRLWIVAILSGIGFLVFLADRFIVLVKPNLDKLENARSGKSIETLEVDVLRTLESYAIEEKWIKKQRIALPSSENHRDIWIVRVPRDVPLASLHFDLKTLVENYDGSTFAVENVKSAEVTFHIKLGGRIQYSLIFIRTSEVKRRTGNITLFVDGISDAPESEIESLIAQKEPVSVILSPDHSVLEKYEKLRAARMDIVLHLHVDASTENESKYHLSETLDDKTFMQRVRFITKSFSAARFYYVTSDNALEGSTKAVEEVLHSKGFVKISAAEIIFLDRTSEQSTISSKMNDIADISVRRGKALGALQLKEGVVALLQDEIMRIRKKGFEFIRIQQYFGSAHEGTEK